MTIPEQARTPLQKLEAICDEIFERWDKDQRSGKLLTALAGRLTGYRADVDEVRAALVGVERTGLPGREDIKRAVRDGHWFKAFTEDEQVGAAEVGAFLNEIAEAILSLPAVQERRVPEGEMLLALKELHLACAGISKHTDANFSGESVDAWRRLNDAQAVARDIITKAATASPPAPSVPKGWSDAELSDLQNILRQFDQATYIGLHKGNYSLKHYLSDGQKKLVQRALSSPPAPAPEGDDDVMEAVAVSASLRAYDRDLGHRLCLSGADTIDMLLRKLGASPAPPASVPEGWQLVPKELTEDLRDLLDYNLFDEDVDDFWARFLAESPPAPAPEREWREIGSAPKDQEVEVRGRWKLRGGGVEFTHWRPLSPIVAEAKG